MELSKKAWPSTVAVTQEQHRIVGSFLNQSHNYKILHYSINEKMLCIWLSICSVDSPHRAKQLVYNICCTMTIET